MPARLIQRSTVPPHEEAPVDAVPAPAAVTAPPIASILSALQEPPAKPGAIFPDVTPVTSWPPAARPAAEELPIPPPTRVAESPKQPPVVEAAPAPKPIPPPVVEPPSPAALPAPATPAAAPVPTQAPPVYLDPVAELRRYFFLFLIIAFPLIVLLSFFAGLWAGRGSTPTIMVNVPVPSAVVPPPPALAAPSEAPAESKKEATPSASPSKTEEKKPAQSEPPPSPAKAVPPTTPAETSASPTPPAPVTPEPPAKPDVAQAEKILREFLASATVEDRARHALGDEAVLARMREYHRTWPDHATNAGVVKLEHEETDEDTGKPMAIFQVTTEALPNGFPVMLMFTDAGWKVDWDVFTEFRDNRFQNFAKGPAGASGRFHLVVRNTHYFGEKFDGLEGLTAYRLDPPMPDREQYAFAPTGSEVQKKLSEQTGWGRPFTPVLELVKHTSPNGVGWIEIKNIIATDWRPKP